MMDTTTPSKAQPSAQPQKDKESIQQHNKHTHNTHNKHTAHTISTIQTNKQ